MSNVMYIVSPRPLPVGEWMSAPLRMYSNYMEFARSEDFRIVCEKQPESGSPERRIQRYGKYRGNIIVYEKASDWRWICVAEVDWDDLLVRRLRKGTGLSYCYTVSSHGHWPELEEYLSWALEPGEEAEIVGCWNDEVNKAFRQPVVRFDLQEFVDSGKQIEWPGNPADHIRVSAPKQPTEFSLSKEWGETPWLGFALLESGVSLLVNAEMQKQDREGQNS